jgi:hypothetical protein
LGFFLGKGRSKTRKTYFTKGITSAPKTILTYVTPVFLFTPPLEGKRVESGKRHWSKHGPQRMALRHSLGLRLVVCGVSCVPQTQKFDAPRTPRMSELSRPVHCLWA